MTTETSSLLDVFHQIDLEPVSGDGVWLTASDGRRYLDFYGGHAVALLGYNHPRLVATLDSEARRLFFQSNAVELEIRERAAPRAAPLRAEGLHQGLPRELRRRGQRERAPRRVPRDAAEARRRGARRVSRPHRGRLRADRRQRQVVCVPAASVRRDVGRLRRRAGRSPPRSGTTSRRSSSSRSRVSRARARSRADSSRRCAGSRPSAERSSSSTRSSAAWAARARRSRRSTTASRPTSSRPRRASPEAFPPRRCSSATSSPARVKKGDLGTTFGAGPMACALIEAVIDVDRGREPPLARAPALGEASRAVRARSRRVRPGARLPARAPDEGAGPRRSSPRCAIAASSREARTIPNVVRLLPPLILEEDARGEARRGPFGPAFDEALPRSLGARRRHDPAPAGARLDAREGAAQRRPSRPRARAPVPEPFAPHAQLDAGRRWRSSAARRS